MKLKYLVLGASCLALGASTAWAKPKIIDRSVIGWWTFNGANADEQKFSDISGYNGTISSPGTGTSLQTTGGINDSGCGNISTLGKKFTFTLGKDESGANVAQSSTFYSWAFRVKTSSSMKDLPDEVKTGTFLGMGDVDLQTANFGKCLNNHEAWHSVGMRVQEAGGVDMNPNSVYTHAYFCDLTTTGDNRAEIAYNGTGQFPMTVSGTTVTVGGSVAGTSFGGLIDEVMIINRMLSKDEFIRLYKTGETYIYPNPNANPSFASSSGWSSAEGNTYAPGGWPGAAYIVDAGKTMTQDGGTFGGEGSTISLTLGRLNPLVSLVDGSMMQDANGKSGNFTHGTTANRAVTFYDLRLNDGTITAKADGQSMNVTLLDVDAPSAKPFSVSVGDGLTYTFNAGGQVTGSGVLAKTGSGKLLLNNFTAAAGECPKVRLAAGSIKTPRLDGYTDGTVLVAKGSTMAFTGDDTLPTAENKMKIAFDGEKPTAKTAVMTVPDGVTAAMVQDVTQYDGGKVGDVTVENGVVYVEPGYSEDKGAKPMLIWQ